MELDSTTFVTERHTSVVKLNSIGVTQVDIGQIQNLPKILGNTDPVSFIRNLPGVQTGSEYDSGIHIQGCDNAHNEITLAGVPVYGVNHLFGFFSIFNPTHFRQMNFARSSSGNRLGGLLEMELTDTLNSKLSGDISIGIMSSQGTLGVKAGEKSHLRISARQSYMNRLYKRWLQIEGSPIRYGFGDYNISWLYTPTKKDRIWLEGYFGSDDSKINERNFNIGLGMKWGNYTGALHWKHKGDKVSQHHIIFSSGYMSDGIINQDRSSLNLESFIRTTGYKGRANWKDFIFGTEISFHNVLPQSPKVQGIYGSEGEVRQSQKALETSAYTEYRKVLHNRWTIDARLRGNYYLSPEMQYDFSLSPDITVRFNAYHLGKISASYGMRHQYLFQAGLSNIGLPVEFWFAAGKHSLPQYSHQADLSYDIDLFHDIFAVSFNLYWKRLYNQVEYKGDFFDFFNSLYSLDKHLLKGSGKNYGLNLMVHKQAGDLTGWISWSFGRALRQFDNKDYSGIYPANHERIHELNAVCSYQFNKLNLSGTFIYAGGTPFTAPEHYYISAGQIITQNGKHNAYRMRPYIRLDLSATYSFIKNNRQENGINVSLYNVTGRSNDVMYRIKVQNGEYSYGSMSFFLKWVPSISYYHKF